MRLSLVIPCYNETWSLPLLVERCREVAQPGAIEVILIDNGSTDDSAQVLADLLPGAPGCRTVTVKRNEGYGHGILSGLRAAQGDLLAWTHADMQTDPADVLRGLALFDHLGDDIFVKGQRYGRPLADRVFTAGMSVFETLLLRTPLQDINAQPTMFSRRFFQTWENPPKDFSLDLYAYYLARRAGLPVQRFDVHFGERQFGTSHWNMDWRAKWRFIRRTVDYSLRLRASLHP